MAESLTDAYFASTLDVCGLGNGRGVSEKMRNDGFGEKKHVSRAGFAEMAGKLSSDTLFWAEKYVSRQGRGDRP